MEKPVPSQVRLTVPVPRQTLCLVSIPGHQCEDHIVPAEAAECDSEDSPPDQLQAGRRAVGTGHTSGERGRDWGRGLMAVVLSI